MESKNNVGLDQSLVNPVVESLSSLLADYQIFYTNLRGLHWDIQGDKFFELHELYETYYNESAEIIDEIAERIIMLGAHPENKFSVYIQKASIKEISGVSDWAKGINHVLESLKLILKKCRDLQSLAFKAEDTGTASLALHRVKSIEKKIWMLSAYMKE